MFHNEYMHRAHELASEAYAAGEVPVGAVLVMRGTVIAEARNQVEEMRDATAHAEILAIRQAMYNLGTKYLVDCRMFVTLEPCPMCAHAISIARISHLYFGASDEKGGAVYNGPKIYNSSSCHHHPEVFGGIMEKDCSLLLRKFFAKLRK